LSAVPVYDRRGMSHTTVISLGGSIVVPDGVDISFVNQFVGRMRDRLQNDTSWRLAIVIGGGATARVYQRAARSLNAECPPEVQDWVGIAATRVNAEVVRAAFGTLCTDSIVTDPTAPGPITGRVVIGGGWKPGFSTDNVSVRLAESLGATTVINLSNIKQIYTADPKKDSNAKPLTEIGWSEFIEIVGDEWIPGKNTPFDSIATRRAARLKMKVIAADGRDLDNLDAILDGRGFVGTTIGPE
jgi:uridylate kinase